MKKNVFVLALILGGAVACSKNSYNNNNGYGNNPPPPAVDGSFQQTNLVSDNADGGGARTDASLVNPWGLAINPGAHIIWLSSNHGGVTDVYDSTGKTLLGPVPIPSMGNPNGGSPTGVVFSATADFTIHATGGVAKFIFVNEDGTISAWG
ncbi:hypothetical protein ACQ86N_30850 [Puia sp. P3]|uniref:hypothetical protein n=1 Tax=Puia sp. P3 TaxID=3423952 RepID=UPI003D674034